MDNSSLSTEKIEFKIRYAPLVEEALLRGYEFVTSSALLFRSLAEITGPAHYLTMIHEGEPQSFTLSCPADSTAWQDVQKILGKAGYCVRNTRYVRPHEALKVVPVRRTREITPERLDACEYLRLAFCEARIGYHYTTEENTIVALGEKEEFKKTADIGDLAPSRRLAVSAKFMANFQAAGLRGALFQPIEWRPRKGMTYVPDNPIRTHWLNAEKEMPRCLTPRVGFSGDLTGVQFFDNQELSKHAQPDMECGWDDEGRTDFTLRFHRKEVEVLGDFDIARTYEWIHLVGNENPRWFPQLIVSQRFRQWAKKQRYKLHYGLCELVD